MERRDIERWLAGHPEAVHGDPAALLDRCECEVRERARRDAWRSARRVAEERLHHFETHFGLPASDGFVAREVCHEMARSLKGREPHPGPESDAAQVSAPLLEAVSPGTRSRLRAWLLDLARQEEHEAWGEIVRFTHGLAHSLAPAGAAGLALDWDFAHSYPRTAARVARVLVDEFEARASGREASPTGPAGND